MSNVPVVTKNLLIINVILFAATFLGERFFKTNVMGWLVLYDPHSVLFRGSQLLICLCTADSGTSL